MTVQPCLKDVVLAYWLWRRLGQEPVCESAGVIDVSVVLVVDRWLPLLWMWMRLRIDALFKFAVALNAIARIKCR